ncbi:MAG TPA: hypothetical protein VFV38_21530 [Ktedonobacteraceae bacterium]|nr:hypothetical protein [Ktedonobacteraceae bacterium]
MMNKAGASRQAKTILVVEDDMHVGEFLTDLFKMELRSRVLLATNGREALDNHCNS